MFRVASLSIPVALVLAGCTPAASPGSDASEPPPAAAETAYQDGGPQEANGQADPDEFAGKPAEGQADEEPIAAEPAVAPAYGGSAVRPSESRACEGYADLMTTQEQLEVVGQFLTADYLASLDENVMQEVLNNVAYECSQGDYDSPVVGAVVNTVLSYAGATWDDIVLDLPTPRGDTVIGDVTFPGEARGLRVVSQAEFDDFWAVHWSYPPEQGACIGQLNRDLVSESNIDGMSVQAYYTWETEPITKVGCGFPTAAATRSEGWARMLDGVPLIDGVACVPGGSHSNDTCGLRANGWTWYGWDFEDGDHTAETAALVNAVVAVN